MLGITFDDPGQTRKCTSYIDSSSLLVAPLFCLAILYMRCKGTCFSASELAKEVVTVAYDSGDNDCYCCVIPLLARLLDMYV